MVHCVLFAVPQLSFVDVSAEASAVAARTTQAQWSSCTPRHGREGRPIVIMVLDEGM